jgi:hypothetical protein
MKKLLLVFTSFILLNALMAQERNHWSTYTDVARINIDKSASRQSFPKAFKLFNLNANPLKQEMFSTVGKNAVNHSMVISLPNADGQIEQFEIVEASNFDAALQAQFPEIRSFSGKGITDKSATIKLSFSPQGLQSMIFRTEKDNEFIEPYSQDHTVYAVFKSQRNKGSLPWSCTTQDQRIATGINTQIAGSGIFARSGADLKTMRLAQSVTAEYSNYFGATSAAQVGLVLAGINATLTRCNGVYEKDLALHLNLVAASTNVIYYNAATDPYDAATAGSGGTWNAQLQSTLTSVIGEANYDIGHLFGASGGGGNAGCIGCVCTNGSKGSGFTSPADGIPQGDNFDIDYVVHEVGHQLGGNHTFSMSNEGTGVNKEIGSGITIMGYAGITAQDVAPHSIDIYHEATIAQIQANLATKTCPITTAITNATPVVAAVSNYTIPKSTPFALTGSATDANASDVLTYCWEQNDNASASQTAASSVASATKATGPNWITFRPTTSPTRYFPQLSTILAGALITGPLTGGDAGTNIEALSSVARALNFRLTVRDNAPFSSTAPISVGQTSFTDMIVTVSAASGPFAVSSPNTAVTWAGGSTQTITWSVASTTATPVSCANVKISLSTDGGLTFPTVLAASTPNDGTEALVIPAKPSTTARIKIEAVGNIFFDISNTNFTIGGTVACGDPTGLASSAIGNTIATVSWTSVTNAINYAVDYKLNAAAIWTNFSTAQTTTSANLTGLTQGSLYDWRVKATCTAGSGNTVAAQFTTTAPFVCAAPTGLAASVITTTGASVSWSAVSGAASYAVDYKLSTATTWTSVATATTATTVAISGLTASTLYDYRISTNCGTNGASGFTAAQFTTTAPFVCAAPAGLAATGISATGATVSWTAVSGAASYAVDYKLNTSTTWISAATATTTTSVAISGLTTSSLYDYRVSTNCGTNGASGFTAAQFTTIAASVCGTAFEPNETIATAAAISNGVTNSAAITTATDIDIFKITTTATSSIVYNLVGPSGVDYDLTIFNSAGTQIGSSAGTTATETVSLTSQAAGTYYIQVIGYNGAFSATCYTIKATASTATSCLSTYDNAANNTANNATSTAPVIPFNTDITGQIATSGDIDQYKFTITTAGTITLTLTTLPANFNLRLINSAGSILVTSAQTGTTSESIAYTAAAGVYYARVYAPVSSTFNATSCYTLKVQLGTATKPGDVNAETSSKKLTNVYPNPAHDKLNINITGYEGVSEIRVLDVNGKQLATQRTAQTNSIMDISKFARGIYLVKIYTSNGEVINRKIVKQ